MANRAFSEFGKIGDHPLHQALGSDIQAGAFNHDVILKTEAWWLCQIKFDCDLLFVVFFGGEMPLNLELSVFKAHLPLQN